MDSNLMDKIVSLAKRRGFIFPGSEIYGGLANSWDYGPLGVELKNNIKQLWWKMFVQSRDDMVGIDAALIMNPKVWEESGHLKNFTDPLVECRNCHKRFRADELGYEIEKTTYGFSSKRISNLGEKCRNCGKEADFTMPKMFNLMFETFIGPLDPINKIFNLWFNLKKAIKDNDKEKIESLNEEINIFFDKDLSESIAYFRPETAQAMFVDFKNVLDTTRKKLPFGIAQIGKAFRNEITPGNFIFRTREFEQMEIEYFVREEEWEKWFEHWRKEMHSWMEEVGIDMSKIHDRDIPKDELAHYSKRTIDIEFEYPFGQKELYGLAYRTDFDLKSHYSEPPYKDQETGEEIYPHVIEPSLGVDRTVLAVLLSAYTEENDRVYLKLPPRIAPYKAAIFPLLANKPELVAKAKEIYDNLRSKFMIAWDDRGNIGKRYYSQDEIGTPFCITVDFDSLEKEDVTVRDRDTGKQDRIPIKDLEKFIVDRVYKA